MHMARRRSACDRSMRRFQQKVVTSTTPAVTAAAAPSKSLVGGGGVDALRAVDGVKKLKEDRRRAAQAVAKVRSLDGISLR